MEESTKASIEMGNSDIVRHNRLDDENLALGIVAGIAGAAIGAIIWALITFWTSFQIGYMAIGVGFLVGIAVRFAGKGVTPKFGVVGALLALVGCLAGNVLASCIWAAKEFAVSVFQIFPLLDLQLIGEILKETFSPLDLLFYALAIYAGYRFSFRRG